MSKPWWYDLLYWWRMRPIRWWIKRPWCWLFGHDVHELPGPPYVATPRYKGLATHMCGRCLKFWHEVDRLSSRVP